MSISRITLILICTSALLACTAPITKPELDINLIDNYVIAELAEPLDRVTTFYIDSWNSLDKSHLILWINGHRPYLLTLVKDCHNLSFSEAIRLDNKTNSIYAGLDAVHVLGFHYNPPCYIDKIHALNKVQAKAIQKLKHHKIKPEASPPASKEAVQE